MNKIDLRSDTVTLPTTAMMDAMQSAPLGDDVLGDEPTVMKLEQMAAERMGKEAALLVPSGTMGNLIAVLVHCARGEEVILGDKSHTFLYEAGGISAYGGVHPHLLANQADGTLRMQDIESAIRDDNIHFPRTQLICLENTHNKCKGTILKPDYLDAVAQLAKEQKLAIHVDGARIFNASVALDCDVKELTRSCDTITFCLSKGLSCPVGSVLCGSADFIHEARRIRKGLGGGMRQSGVIASAGIVALESMIDRLAEDHENAKTLAKGLAEIDAITIDTDSVQTNMVYFSLAGTAISDEMFLEQAEKKGLAFFSLNPRHFRLVTHANITRTDIDTAIKIIGQILNNKH